MVRGIFDCMKDILVKSIMTENITVATLDHKFSQVMEYFERFSVRHLPVTDGNKIVGIISIIDVIKDLYKQLSTGKPVTMQEMDETFKIRDIMTPTPVTIEPDTTIEEAMTMLLKDGFHALPVAENGELKGMVTYHDLLNTYFKEKNPPAFYSPGAPGFGI